MKEYSILAHNYINGKSKEILFNTRKERNNSFAQLLDESKNQGFIVEITSYNFAKKMVVLIKKTRGIQ